MKKTPRAFMPAALAAVLCLSAGCAGTPAIPDANTPCSEFMKLDQSTRDQAVNTVATQLGNPDAVTPLGRPNVEYLCAQDPSLTLGKVIDLSRIAPKPTPSATTRAPAKPAASTPPPTKSAAPTPAPATPLLVDTWTDESGYSFKAELLSATSTAQVNIADALPGKARIERKITMELRVTNTTPGRTIHFRNIYINAAPVWLANSDVCSLDVNNAVLVEDGNGYEAATSVCSPDPAPKEFDMPTIGGSQPWEFASGESATVVKVSQYTFHTSEEDAQKIASSMAKPAGWIMARYDKGVERKCQVTRPAVKSTIDIAECDF